MNYKETHSMNKCSKLELRMPPLISIGCREVSRVHRRGTVYERQKLESMQESRDDFYTDQKQERKAFNLG